MIITEIGPFSQPAYQTFLVVVSDGYVYYGQPGGTLLLAAGQGVSRLCDRNANVSMAFINLKVFIADGGQTVKVLDCSTGSVGNLSATSGTVPTNCSLACNWRGRLVLAGDSNNPQNYYMARPEMTLNSTLIAAGTDWLYGQSDSASPVAGNLSASGQIGEPITAMIPFSDDYLKISTVKQLWMVQGDPADGGSMVKVSDNMGLAGKDAWCIDPQGTLWFVATGGLFQVRPAWEFYRPPEPVSIENYDQFFQSLSYGTQNVACVWDADRHYLHLFVTPTNGTAGTHLVWDSRTQGFWPQQFPSTMGPNAACLYVGDGAANNRLILLGGQDGYVRSLSPAATDDDGTAINAYVVLGPYQPVPGQAALLVGTTLNMAETPAGQSSTNWNVVATLAAGPTAYDVTEGVASNLHPAPSIAMTLDRRQKTFRQRLRGGFFTLKLANTLDNDFFGLESGVLEFLPAGRKRNVR